MVPQVDVGPSVVEMRRLELAERRAGRAAGLVVRPGRPEDELSLRRLATAERRLLPGGEFLVAEVGGAVVAAVALEADGRPYCDPVRPAADICALLELRAERLRTQLPEAA